MEVLPHFLKKQFFYFEIRYRDLQGFCKTSLQHMQSSKLLGIVLMCLVIFGLAVLRSIVKNLKTTITSQVVHEHYKIWNNVSTYATNTSVVKPEGQSSYSSITIGGGVCSTSITTLSISNSIHIPIFLITKDRLRATQIMIDSIHSLTSSFEIIILDQGTGYPPMVTYLDSLPQIYKKVKIFTKHRVAS